MEANASIKVVRKVSAEVEKALKVISDEVQALGYKEALAKEVEAIEKKIEEIESEEQKASERFGAEKERLNDSKEAIESLVDRIELGEKYLAWFKDMTEKA